MIATTLPSVQVVKMNSPVNQKMVLGIMRQYVVVMVLDAILGEEKDGMVSMQCILT